MKLAPIDSIAQLDEVTTAVARHAISSGLVNAELFSAPENPVECQNDSVDVTMKFIVVNYYYYNLLL